MKIVALIGAIAISSSAWADTPRPMGPEDQRRVTVQTAGESQGAEAGALATELAVTPAEARDIEFKAVVKRVNANLRAFGYAYFERDLDPVNASRLQEYYRAWRGAIVYPSNVALQKTSNSDLAKKYVWVRYWIYINDVPSAPKETK